MLSHFLWPPVRIVLPLVIAVLAIGAEPLPPADDAPKEAVAFRAEIQRHMTADQVRKLWGKPDRITRQILFRKHLEQWVYEKPDRLRIEFLCRPGEEARVLNVFPSEPKNSR